MLAPPTSGATRSRSRSATPKVSFQLLSDDSSSSSSSSSTSFFNTVSTGGGGRPLSPTNGGTTSPTGSMFTNQYTQQQQQRNTTSPPPVSPFTISTQASSRTFTTSPPPPSSSSSGLTTSGGGVCTLLSLGTPGGTPGLLLTPTTNVSPHTSPRGGSPVSASTPSLAAATSVPSPAVAAQPVSPVFLTGTSGVSSNSGASASVTPVVFRDCAPPPGSPKSRRAPAVNSNSGALLFELTAPNPLGSDVTVLSKSEKPKGSTASPLSITDIECTTGGPYGILRTNTSYNHAGEICYRFTLHGLTCNDSGASRLETVISVTEADTGDVVEQTTHSTTPTLFMGSGEYSTHVTYNISADRMDYGSYFFYCQVTDLSNGNRAYFSRPFNFEKANEVTISRITFNSDHGRTTYGPISGCVGESAWFKLSCIGFHPSKVLHGKMTFNIREATSTKMLLEKPITTEIKDTVPILPQKGMSLSSMVEQANLVVISFLGNFQHTRTGNFYLCVTVTDKVANHTTTAEIPFSVYKA
ncbi:hypothetical protein Pelo_7978 [Pelomyxa schiedti]|nr:hypothetical protein Pelo_7978 [Pelomyxa schiedti]